MTACEGVEPEMPGDDGEITEPTVPETILDTVVLICGAEYPQAYDWKRDTAYGRVTADMVLFRDGERTLTISTGGSSGLSPHPDMHYLMDDGHLYSQGQPGSSTRLFRDGKEFITYKGYELIRGLAVVGDDIYTLGQSRSGEGFSYRKNGKALLSRSSGHIVGQMNSNPHYPTGALYTDSGQLHFSYWEQKDDGQYLWTLVTDGVEKQLHFKCSPSELFDIRVIDGDVYRLMSTPGTRSCVLITGATEISVSVKNTAVRLCSPGPDGRGGVIVTGENQYSSGIWNSFVWSHAQGTSLSLGRSFYYPGDKGLCEVSFTFGSEFSVSRQSSSNVHVRGDGVYFPSFRNGMQVGGQLHLAINPPGQEERPGYWSDRKWRQLELNGYLNGIQVLLVEKKPS